MSDRVLRPVRRETRDVGFRFMLILLAGIAACLVAMLALAYLIYPRELRDQRFARPFPNFPSPRLQPSPPADMAAFYRQEMARLNGTGWVDRRAGVVHIPIDQAMRDVAARGIPGWPDNAQASEGDRR